VGRDVGRDEGREQAEWRDLVARLELPAPIDAEHAPWPDRENLRTKTQPGPLGSPASGQASQAERTDQGKPAGGESGTVTRADDGHPGGAGTDAGPGVRGPADRSRVIRPAGFTRFSEPTAEPADQTIDGDRAGGPGYGETADYAEAADYSNTADYSDTADSGEMTGLAEPVPPGPRDYELNEPSDADTDEDWDDRYVPPSLPPGPRLDPVAKGAWLALFGGPGYLLLATMLNWQISGWSALTAVAAFVTGFVVLVVKLGDGPSKRDGPDQGAVV